MALLVTVLVVTGLGLVGWLPERLAAMFGGHLWFDTVHRQLGLFLAGAAVLLALWVPAKMLGLWEDVATFRVSDRRWPLAFLRFSLSPKRHPAPSHEGRFDPLQRVVFLGLGISLLLLVVSGVILYFVSPYARGVLAWSVRVHVLATVVFTVLVCLHIFAGSGLLRTHRGVAAVMFGDGRVSLNLAQRLWPGWTRQQMAECDPTLPGAADSGDSPEVEPESTT